MTVSEWEGKYYVPYTYYTVTVVSLLRQCISDTMHYSATLLNSLSVSSRLHGSFHPGWPCQLLQWNKLGWSMNHLSWTARMKLNIRFKCHWIKGLNLASALLQHSLLFRFRSTCVQLNLLHVRLFHRQDVLCLMCIYVSVLIFPMYP